MLSHSVGRVGGHASDGDAVRRGRTQIDIVESGGA